MEVFQQQSTSTPPSSGKRDIPHTPARRSLSQSIHNFAIRFFPKTDFHRPTFPSLASLGSKKSHTPRQSSSIIPGLLSSYASIGPFLSRLVAQGSLASPMVTITLQRDSIDVGGNLGVMAIGELPEGVKNESLTWVPVRGYTTDQGGLHAPLDSPGEVYPIAWEVPVDDVYYDGQKLPRSSLSPSSISLSALIDTVSMSSPIPSFVTDSMPREILSFAGQRMSSNRCKATFPAQKRILLLSR